MNSRRPAQEVRREIGGYFGLELGEGNGNPHSGALALNSGRNAFLYALLALRPTAVYMPSYICGSMMAPLVQAGVEARYYQVDPELEIVGDIEPGPGELLLYVNYFGIKSTYCRRLAEQYGSALVIDNSQAFFAPPLRCAASLYSPRKFFGVSDGGFL